jgi:hypothetical protein
VVLLPIQVAFKNRLALTTGENPERIKIMKASFKSTRRFLSILAIVGSLSLTGETGALSQLSASFEFDESGNGYLSGPDLLPQFLPFTMATEPISGMTTLRYTLPAYVNGVPFQPASGTLYIYDSSGSELSDLIVFDTQYLYFFSQLEPGETPELADVPELPTIIYANPEATGNALEIDLGGGNMEANYVSLLGGPGSTFARIVDYTFISSEVPEPGAGAIITVGLFLMLKRRRRIR